MRRYRPLLPLLVPGLLLLLGAAVLHHRSAHRSDALLRTGARTVGTVLRHGHVYKGRDYVTVRFATGPTTSFDGILYTYSSHPDGSQVELWYDPTDPARFRTRSEANLKDDANGAVPPMVAIGGTLTTTALLAPLLTRRTARRRDDGATGRA